MLQSTVLQVACNSPEGPRHEAVAIEIRRPLRGHQAARRNLMLQPDVLPIACNSPMGPTSLHFVSLLGARLQSGACKLVGNGAQNPGCYLHSSASVGS